MRLTRVSVEDGSGLESVSSSEFGLGGVEESAPRVVPDHTVRSRAQPPVFDLNYAGTGHCGVEVGPTDLSGAR